MTRDDYPAVVAEHNDIYAHLLQRRVVALQEQRALQAKLETLGVELYHLDRDLQALAKRIPEDPDESVLDQLAEDFDFILMLGQIGDEIYAPPDPDDDCPF